MRSMLFHSLGGEVKEIITIFSYLGSKRWYKILLCKLLCTCASAS